MAEINAKVTKGSKGVSIAIHASTYFGDMDISVNGYDLGPNQNVYDCAQEAIDFVKDNINDKKENTYYG